MTKARWALAVGMLVALAAPAMAANDAARWTPSRAHAWYAKQAWPIGSNYIPANAINQFEMWQADTFDPARIDKELGWAQALGMTTMRVFLHDQLWQQDAAGFKKRIDTFLAIAARHGIKPMLVLFDSCWDPVPKPGKQHAPVPGVHNSGWVQGPGVAMDDPSQYPRLKDYTVDIVRTFAADPRILAWDVWNEPDNPGGGNYTTNPKDKFDRVAKLLPQVFDWARSASPTQPLTSGVWHDDDWAPGAKLNAVETTQLERSDIITFHSYDWPETFVKRVAQLQPYGRPMICTEYMARGAGSTIDEILPLGKKLDIGMIQWGFVEGKTQTTMPWDSWDKPYVQKPPVLWFHDLLRADGTPYRQREADIVRLLSKSPRGVVPPDAVSYPLQALKTVR
jgi:hypothetical protein